MKPRECSVCQKRAGTLVTMAGELVLCTDHVVERGKLGKQYGLNYVPYDTMQWIAHAIAAMPVATNDIESGHAAIMARMFSGAFGVYMFMIEHPPYVGPNSWRWTHKLARAAEEECFWDILCGEMDPDEFTRLSASLNKTLTKPKERAV